MEAMTGIGIDKNLIKRSLGVPFGLLILLAMMILPIHPFLLDIFFTFSITLSLLVLLACIYCSRPLDLAAFPTILLLATLLRLALNVASTRVVLLNGHIGEHAAGRVIEAFGQVVIGGNYAVGLVVFAILVIINFVVVTKGAGRISEVSARFTLDALPGKQMSIDADLNAGIINQEEAKVLRKEVVQEADFYGSMDGASKFVRGDAVAGILILLINLIGGITIGTVQHDMNLSDAAQIYALLTIGDGLVAQIPSLVLSTAAAIMVTRVSSSENMSQQLAFQIFNNPKPVVITSIILITLGLIPGMPHVPFIGLGGIIIGLSWYFNVEKNRKIQIEKNEETNQEKEDQREEEKYKDISWDDVAQVDTIGLEIGYRLIPLVDKNQSGELMTRIKGVRKKLSQELGFLVPSVHIRDNLDLSPNAYRISILGVTVGEDKVFVDKNLAINPGQVFGELDGIRTKDPTFGLDAFWIEKEQKQHAQTLGYTVVDASTVVATHLSQVVNEHSYQLIGHEEVQKLIDNLSKEAPNLTEELVPKTLSLGVIVKVIQNLLRENIPVKDMRTIAEVLVDAGQKSKDPLILTEAVRVGLGSMIVQQINGFAPELPVMTLDPNLEQLLHKSMQSSADNIMIEPSLAEKLQISLRETVEKQEIDGIPSVLLVHGAIRNMMSRFTRSFLPTLNVLSYQEIPEDAQVKVIGTIGSGV